MTINENLVEKFEGLHSQDVAVFPSHRQYFQVVVVLLFKW